ncbi:VOC family protein [Vibrio quintilis]|uniref:Glyoxalase-like domain protein n=1 Tax=Vibrio quintilis TaxID=1117707 RepID=A0A1M7YWN0_9VIBR|nr:Glyoxalase-like domain protein [Vibrio quintilis]
MKNPVCWFEIYVTDMQRAQQFYETVFDTKLDDLDPGQSGMEMRTFPSDMEQYGAGGALVKMDGVAVGQHSVMVYFSCEDCSVEQVRVTEAGGTIERPKFPIGEYGFVSLVSDTEGNMIGLHSLK